MRRRLTSRFPELAAAFVALGGALSSNDAAAQACCAGAGAYAPVRLKLWENAIVGIQVKGVDELGSFDTNWNYIHPPAGVSEQDLEQDVVAVVRFSERGQVGLQIPVVETRRADPGIAEFGGGIGDVSVSARYDFILSTDYPRLPGIALVAGITAPSGRAPDQAKTPLAVDATGTGAWQGTLGLSIEKLVGAHVILSTNLAVSASLPRTVDLVTEELGPRFIALLAAGYAFKGGAALAVTLGYNATTDVTLAHAVLPDSGQALLTAGLAGGLPVADDWRLQGVFSYDLPWLGQDKVAGVGLGVTVVRSF